MYRDELPLGLPKGSVRAILSMTIIGSTILIYLIKGTVPEFLVTAFGTAYGFYFASRRDER